MLGNVEWGIVFSGVEERDVGVLAIGGAAVLSIKWPE